MMKSRMSQKKEGKKGFTLIELSLAIVFVAILSLTIALMITDAVRSYRRGMVLNQINTVGMDLSDDIRAAVQNSPANAIADECVLLYGSKTTLANNCVNDGANKLVVFVRKANLMLNGERLTDVPVSGGVCFGSYSYLWNSGYFYSDEVTELNDDRKVSLVYNSDKGTGLKKEGFRLLKVKDELREICRIAAGVPDSYSDVGTTEFELREALSEEPIDVLSRDKQNNSLALYDLTTATPAENGANNAMFYSVSFILGTIQGGMNVTASGNLCSSPDGYNAILDYCAINKFNFAAQAAGE